MAEPTEWPDPSWHIGQRDHLHALGVITASYNILEFHLFFLFMRHLHLKPKLAQRLFVILSNHHRIELLRTALAENSDKEAVSQVEYFLKAFEILAGSRNFLAHSHTTLNNPDQDHLTFGKGSKGRPEAWSYAHLTLSDLRKIAEDIRAFSHFAGQLDAWLLARPTGGVITSSSGASFLAPLPQRPPLPTALKNVPHGIPQ